MGNGRVLCTVRARSLLRLLSTRLPTLSNSLPTRDLRLHLDSTVRLVECDESVPVLPAGVRAVGRRRERGHRALRLGVQSTADRVARERQVEPFRTCTWRGRGGKGRGVSVLPDPLWWEGRGMYKKPFPPPHGVGKHVFIGS